MEPLKVFLTEHRIVNEDGGIEFAEEGPRILAFSWEEACQKVSLHNEEALKPLTAYGELIKEMDGGDYESY